MKKPLRGRRSGPLWFLILLVIGGGVYGALTYLPPIIKLRESLARCERTHQAGAWEEAVTACATAVSLAPGNATASFMQQDATTRWPVALGGTATVQALETPTAGGNLTPGNTPTPRPSDTPVPTPTPVPDFYQMIIDFRRAERAALQTLDPNVLAQVPVFANGEALAAINQQVETLRSAGQYEVLIVEDIRVEQIMPGSVVGVLVSERHSRQTFAHATDGDRLGDQAVNNYSVVYGFVEDNGRWKIDKVRMTISLSATAEPTMTPMPTSTLLPVIGPVQATSTPELTATLASILTPTRNIQISGSGVVKAVVV